MNTQNRTYGRKDAGAADDKSVVEIKQALDRITDQVKEQGERALAEAKTASGLAESTRQKVDELLTEQGELKNRLTAIEQKAVRAPAAEGDGETVGAALKAAEGKLGDFMSARSAKASVQIPISRKALTNTGVTGTALNYPGAQLLPTPLEPLLRRLTVRDLIAPGRTTGAVVWYQRESGFTNNAAVVSEGSRKPKSELIFELITENVRTIAHLFDISLQMLNDLSYIESYIARRGMYGLKLIEEAQLLTGSGVGQNLEGIYTAATAYSAPSGATINGAAPGGAGETDLDKLRLALLQVELANAFANGIVLHPTDWASIELLKETSGQYLFTNPQNTTTGRIWGRDVVSTQALTQGRFLTGDFAMHSQILDREDANIAISFENNDNFERNMASIRIEERLALAIYRPEAFVKGTLESAS